jgi:large subunit ribosomal protein L12
VKYVYAALLLHASDKEINEENINKIITSTGETVDEARVKALVASLAEVNIDEAIKVSPGITTAPVSQAQAPVPEKKEEEKEEKKEDEAIAGLGALFG